MEKYSSKKWPILIAINFIVWGLFTNLNQPNTIWYWIGGGLTAALSGYYVYRYEESGKKHDGWNYFRFQTLMILTIARCIGWMIRNYA